MEKKEKEKLSLKQTMKNAWYAVVLGASLSPSIVVHSFFLWLINHAEWVFFDGIFMRKICRSAGCGSRFSTDFPLYPYKRLRLLCMLDLFKLCGKCSLSA